MSTPCGACGAPTGDDAHLCQGDTQRLRGTLADIPGLLAELDTTSTRQTVAPAAAIGDDPCQHHGDCGCGVTLPWNDRASRIAHGLQNALVTWCRVVLDDCDVTHGPPMRGAEPAWLTYAVPAIRHQPWAPNMLADLTQRRDDAEHAIDRPEDRLYAGPCGSTIDLGDGITQQCERRIWARPEDAAVKCRTCGTVHIVADRQAWMLTAAADLLMPTRQLASVLTLMLRRRISPATLRGWAAQGKLEQRGLDPQDRKLYRFGQAHELVQRMDTEGKTA